MPKISRLINKADTAVTEEKPVALRRLRSNKAGVVVVSGAVIVIWSALGFAAYEILKAPAQDDTLIVVDRPRRPSTMPARCGEIEAVKR